MKSRIVFLFLSLLSAAFAEQEYIDHPLPQKKTRAMWRGDRWIVGDRLQVWLDWPSSQVLPESKEIQRDVAFIVRLSTDAGKLVAEWPQTLKITKAGVLPRPSVSLSCELPSELPDGEYVLSFESDAAFEPGVLPEPLPLRKAAGALAKVSPEYREEIASWVAEGNHERLIWGKQPLWPNLQKALMNPSAPYKGLRGLIIRSYQSRHLRRRQPYTVYVPESLDLSEPAPLMILLHGSRGDYRNLVADYAAGQRFEEHPMLIANAGAFQYTEFRHMPLEDVREIIEDMKQKYNVDPKRIYAQGISLGGRGVLELAALMPDTFAAVSSHGTYGIHHEWMDPLFALHRDPVAFQLAARSDIRTWMPNLATTPVEMVFGWQDTSTRPVGALAIAIQLERLRYKVVERGFDTGHNITLPQYDWASTRQWLLKYEKELWPRRLRFRVANLRHNRFSWIRVDALHDPSAIGEVEAFYTEKGPTFKVRNIARLTVIPPPEGEASVGLEPRTYGFDEQGLLLEEELTDIPPHYGPLWDAFYEPVIMVVDPTVKGTMSFSEERIRKSSRLDATPVFEFPVVKGDEVSAEDRASHNLMIYTTRESSWEWKEDLKIRLPEDVQEMREPLDTLIAIHPSPWSKEHKIILIEAGNGNGFVMNPYHAGLFQEPLQADWLLIGRNRRMKAGGSFYGDGRPGPWTRMPFVTRVITR